MKKLCAALLTAAMLASTAVSALAAEPAYYVSDVFSDVQMTDWYFPYIQHAYDLGFMSGTGGDYFSPDDVTTRAMFVQILYSAAEKPSVEGMKNPFEDVPDTAWYHDAVVWAYNKGVTAGVSETSFGPEEEVTREQVTLLLYSLMQSPDADGYLFEYADAEEIHSWACNSMVWAVSEGLMTGSVEDGRLCLRPADNITRAEASVVLTNFYAKYYNAVDDVTLPEAVDVDTSAIESGVRVPVMMYHEVSEEVWGYEENSYMFVTPESLEAQLQYLADNGYETIFFSDLDHLEDYEKPVILTFDDGYEGNYDNLYPLLQKYNMKATIFVGAKYIGSDEHHLTVDQIREMSDSGYVSIQSHTYTHSKLNTMDEEELRFECTKSISTLASITGKLPYVISYPEGAYSELSLQVISRYFTFGILDRGGVWVSNDDYYTINRYNISRDCTIEEYAELLER